MKKILFAICISVSFGLVLTSCKGDRGPTGPQGNANVRALTFDVVSSDWQYQTNPQYQYYVNLTEPDISQDILDNGMVIVYLSNGNNGWQAIPVTGYIQGSSGGSTYNLEYKYSPVYGLTQVTVWYYIVTNPTAWIPPNPGSQTFKVVVVAGSLTSGSKVNWNNYDEVKKAFNLPD